MAHINMATPFDSNNGKYARTDQIHFKIRKFDEQTIGVRMKHPATNEPPSAAQQAAQTKLVAAAARAKTALADAEQKATLKAEWKAQKKYKTLLSYAIHKFYNTNEGGNNNG